MVIDSYLDTRGRLQGLHQASAGHRRPIACWQAPMPGNQGRFLDASWTFLATCETCGVEPDLERHAGATCCPDVRPCIDLRVAGVGRPGRMLYCWAGRWMPLSTMAARVNYEIKRQIIQPYLTTTSMWRPQLQLDAVCTCGRRGGALSDAIRT